MNNSEKRPRYSRISTLFDEDEEAQWKITKVFETRRGEQFNNNRNEWAKP